MNNDEITVVLQGALGGKVVENAVVSVKKYLPGAKIIISTWKGEVVPQGIEVDEIIFNDDPGMKTRDGRPDGKPNNINRQIVSSLNGLKAAKTKYALKMRTDFLMVGNGFLEKFGKFDKFEENYKVANERIMVCMFGTRKPRAKHFNLPFHVSDFAAFGMYEDLLNLYDIPLVTDEEFEWFKIHTEIKPDTFAISRYNAEQSIIVNWLTKNGKHVPCEYSTHVDDEIARESDHFLVNNFYPMHFSVYGLEPQKDNLKYENNVERYTDYYTQFEWMELYKKYCDNNFELPKEDAERKFINKAIKRSQIKKLLLSLKSKIPFFRG